MSRVGTSVTLDPYCAAAPGNRTKRKEKASRKGGFFHAFGQECIRVPSGCGQPQPKHRGTQAHTAGESMTAQALGA